MIIYFIRHGQSANNALLAETRSRTGRQDDPELTPRGEQQAALLAAFLESSYSAGGAFQDGANDGGFGVTHIYTSLMIRAVKTAAVVSSCLELPLHGLEMLHENGGMYIMDEDLGQIRTTMGKTRAYYRKFFPKLVLPEIQAEGWWGCQPFEESSQCRKRAEQLLGFLLERHENETDRVALISHADFYNEFLHVFLDIPRKPETWFTIHNTGITRLDLRSKNRRVVYSNRTAHLPTSLLTS